jgi:hypothetical protein
MHSPLQTEKNGTSNASSLVGEAKRDPITFARVILGQNPWRVQRDILTSAAINPLTAVKSCHSSGKTYNAAAVALWALARWRESLVITTAPTFRQVKDRAEALVLAFAQVVPRQQTIVLNADYQISPI